MRTLRTLLSQRGCVSLATLTLAVGANLVVFSLRSE